MKWGLDVLNAGAEIAYDGHVNDARWTPLSTLSTTPRPTTLGWDTQVLISTGNAATFGIPAGTYSLATGNYQTAQDYFGGGALTLISADLAGVRSSNLDFSVSQTSINRFRFIAANAWGGIDDGFGVRMPTTPTLQNVPTMPDTPPAIVYTMDPKTPAGAGPNSGR